MHEKKESILLQLLDIVNKFCILDDSIDFNKPGTYPSKLTAWFKVLEMLLQHQVKLTDFAAGKNFIFELIKKNYNN